MNVKVLKKFVDRNTRELHEEGKSYDYEDEKRVEELVNGGYVKVEGKEAKEDAVPKK